MKGGWQSFGADGKLAFRFPVVYIMQFDGATKIGVSVDPPFRARTLTAMSGREFCRGVYLPGDYAAIAVERRLHAQFDSYRLSGEWFSCGIDLILEQANIDRSTLPERHSREIDPDKAEELLDWLFGHAKESCERFGVELSSSLLAHVCVCAEHHSVDFKVSEAIHSMIDTMQEMGDVDYCEQYHQYQSVIIELVASFLSERAVKP